jgi:hypothetical protein
MNHRKKILNLASINVNIVRCAMYENITIVNYFMNERCGRANCGVPSCRRSHDMYPRWCYVPVPRIDLCAYRAEHHDFVEYETVLVEGAVAVLNNRDIEWAACAISKERLTRNLNTLAATIDNIRTESLKVGKTEELCMKLMEYGQIAERILSALLAPNPVEMLK